MEMLDDRPENHSPPKKKWKNIMEWIQKSGFNVHARGRINGSDGDAFEKVDGYMSRAAISFERVEFNPAEKTVTVYERQDRSDSGLSTTYTIMQFIALLAGHIPSPYTITL